ncbi:MAG: hypothetical protein EHM80_07480 [Nitrospiraceae bacterium]|nr:MAG: hypothetical protein EHM80_07480 [Nitrospiraceae bacterium]
MWSAEVLEVNPSCDVTVHHIGAAKHKVLLADNFYRHPQKVTELALELYYTESRAVVGSYPGSRAMITLDTTPLIRMLGKLWGEPLRPFHTEYHPVIFSAILNRDYQLTPLAAATPHRPGNHRHGIPESGRDVQRKDRPVPTSSHRPLARPYRNDGRTWEARTTVRVFRPRPQNPGRLAGIHQQGLLPPRIFRERKLIH